MNLKWSVQLIHYVWWIAKIFAEMKFLVNAIICQILGIQTLMVSRGTLLYFLSLCSLICWFCRHKSENKMPDTDRNWINEFIFGYCCRIIPNVVFSWVSRKTLLHLLAAFGNFFVVFKDKKFICFGFSPPTPPHPSSQLFSSNNHIKHLMKWNGSHIPLSSPRCSPPV